MKKNVANFLFQRFIFLLIGLVLFSSENIKAQNPSFPYPIIFVHGWTGNEESWTDITNQLGGQTRIYDVCLNHDGNRSSSNLTNDINLVGWRDNATKSPSGLYVVNFDNTKFHTTGHENHNESNQSAIYKQGSALGKVIAAVLTLEPKADKVVLVGHSMGGLAIREYLQRDRVHWVDPSSADGHKVAKVVTIGTPHRGSNVMINWMVDLFPFLPLDDIARLAGYDDKSESVRDLRWNYDGIGFLGVPGKYLFGGSENTAPFNFYNSDINCDGDENDEIVGLNAPNDGTTDNTNIPLPTNIQYTWIVGQSTLWGGSDGVVDCDRQWLFNSNKKSVPLNVSDTLMITNSNLLLFHLHETEDLAGFLRGLDEPEIKELAYEIQFGIPIKGYITKRTQNNTTDVDVFKLSTPNIGKILFSVTSANAQIDNVTIQSKDGESVKTISGNLPFNIEIENTLPDNIFYCAIHAIPSGNPYNSQYTLEAKYYQLDNGAVTPERGTTTDQFQFKVVYKSLPGKSPDFINLIVDGTSFPMSPIGSDWQNGVTYSCNRNFSQGTHNYHFEGSIDGLNLVYYPAIDEIVVKESSVGWDALVDPLLTKYSPSNVKPNTTVTITTYVKNNGIYTYLEVPVRVEMRNPQGTLIGSDYKTVYDLAPGNSKSVISQIIVPSSSSNGTYSITSCAMAALESNYTNDCYTNYFYIGENLSNEQFRNTVGQQTLTTETGKNTISIKGNTFTLVHVYEANNYATFRDPNNGVDKVTANMINVYGSYDALIQGDAFWMEGTIGHASVTGYGAILYGTGATFDNVEINANPGATVYAYATAQSGNLFSSSDGDYELYSTSTTEIKDWYNGVSRDGTSYNRIKIEFSIPSDASMGRTTLYFRTPYSNPSGVSDMTRLSFYITNPLPAITTISKTNISADDQIIITGTNLGTSGTVNFNSIQSVSIQTWTNTSITCTVPQGISSGILTVTNSNGTSNGMSYTVLSQTGVPIVLTTIPNQQLYPSESRSIIDLDNVFSDPNGTALTFTVNTNNSQITIDETTFPTDHILRLIGATDLLYGSLIVVTATDASGKSGSTSFNVSVPPILKVSSSYLIFDADEGTAFVGITTNVPWTLSLSEGWINSSITGNVITLTTQANTTVYQRSAVLTITGGGIQNEVQIGQGGITLSLPVFSTSYITTTTATSANTRGNIISDGGSSVIERGVCWSTNTYPKVDLVTKTSDSTGTGIFTSSITGLSGGTTYYLRAYATNSVGTGYGDLISFKTYNSDAITDIDGNYYNIVTIGTQVWMTENLKTTRFNDGTGIPLVTDNAAWAALSSSGYCLFNNDGSTYKNIYGALYNWYAANNINLCPTGWHTPGDEEWKALEIHLGMTQEQADASAWRGTNQGEQLKSTSGWANGGNGNNSSVFTALPGGFRQYDGAYLNAGYVGLWWSATESQNGYGWRRYLNNSYVTIARNEEVASKGLSVRCVRNSTTAPVLSTTESTLITQISAQSGGNITSDGGSTVTARGVCWSTSPNPTVNLVTKSIDGMGTGAFTSTITGLLAGTTYYLRAYATNSAGTAYGNEVSFKTYNSDAVQDIDGNYYNIVTIGSQIWLQENLRTTKLNDNTPIQIVTDGSVWSGLTSSAYCWYDNNISYRDQYGALYNWYSAGTGKLCPSGWHIPSNTEWAALETLLGGYDIAGGKMKETGYLHWNSPNAGATNESGFTGLGSGYRDLSTYPRFMDMGRGTNFWSSDSYSDSQAWWRGLPYYQAVLTDGYHLKTYGFSVRCIKDMMPPAVSTSQMTSIAQTSAQSGGNITSNGDSPVTARGVCWSTSPNPTVELITKTSDGTGVGPFTSIITGLSAGTTYYLRAYATNGAGTAYGSEISFKAYNSDAIQDVEGNYYNIVTIGSQIWLGENLKTTKYKDNTEIPLVADNTVWSNLTTPGYCWIENNPVSYKNIYGAVYNWFTVNTGKLCPTGWHVPTQAEYTVLVNYLGGETIAGSRLKSTGTIEEGNGLWYSPNTGATNESNFTALPAGGRVTDVGFEGIFLSLGFSSYFWSSNETSATTALYFTLWNQSTSVESPSHDKKRGWSVRCLKDNTIEQSISFSEGWNILSSAVQPSNMSMRTIVDPLISTGSLVKVQDEKGKAVERLSDPIGWINEIGQMSVTEGYKIRVTGNTSLSLTGNPVTLPLNIPLETGWNIIGYPVLSSQSSSTAFSSLITAGTLLKVQDEQGSAIEQINGTWTYSFQNLNPGEGYKVKTNAATTLTISSTAKGETVFEERSITKPVHFKPAYTGNGLDHMNIYLDSPTADGTPLRRGDEIGVFDGSICVGAGVVEGTENRYIQVIVSLDDPVTEVKDGFTDGNKLELRLWDIETEMERKTQAMEPAKGYNNLFEKLGTTVLKADFEGLPRSFLGDAYPNPSSERTMFTFQLAGENRVRFEIYDVMGNLVKILVNETIPAGIHEIEWDNQTGLGSKAKAGMYFYKLTLNGLSQVKQLVIH